MTTPGDNGARTPEEDPFGYLYADGQAAGATPPPGGGGYGYPGRTSSYHQVRTVGERQYGQQAPQQTPQAGYDQSHYSAPETLPADATRQIPPQQGYGSGGNGAGHGGHGGGRGRGPNTKGLLIGAIAVVAAVVVGISIAMLGGDDGEKDPNAGSDSAGTSAGADGGDKVKPSEPSEEKQDKPLKLPKTDAKVLPLAGGAVTASDVPGSKAGTYVAGFSQVGASVTWQIDGFEKPGAYRLYVSYGVPGEDTTGTLAVNGDKQTRPLNMKNFANAKQGEWDKGWTHTYADIQLKEGTNTIVLSCEQSDKCNANIDQMWLTKEG
ncbi:carbohydrate-binding protein [Streptomyces sp. NPDC050418]|uniref:carbohydrate-binding protein n=1 Tax=Streptomyces sp. NPDC050418 TaxID=3365612 RepID=UPI0037976DF8